MASVFSKIISGELPSYKVAETKDFMAFLDIQPNTKGHTLCIPKVEVDKLFDLDEQVYMDLMAFSRKVALALEKTIPCKRIGMSVIGLEGAHVHVHLIPLNKMQDTRFDIKAEVSPEEFQEIAAKVSKAYNDL